MHAFTPRRCRPALLIAALTATALVTATSASAAIHIRGPRTAEPFHHLTVRIFGLRPRVKVLGLASQPTYNRGANGIATVIAHLAHKSRHRGLRVRSEWPPDGLLLGDINSLPPRPLASRPAGRHHR